jgi:hypothetical protein
LVGDEQPDVFGMDADSVTDCLGHFRHLPVAAGDYLADL